MHISVQIKPFASQFLFVVPNKYDTVRQKKEESKIKTTKRRWKEKRGKMKNITILYVYIAFWPSPSAYIVWGTGIERTQSISLWMSFWTDFFSSALRLPAIPSHFRCCERMLRIKRKMPLKHRFSITINIYIVAEKVYCHETMTTGCFHFDFRLQTELLFSLARRGAGVHSPSSSPTPCANEQHLILWVRAVKKKSNFSYIWRAKLLFHHSLCAVCSFMAQWSDVIWWKGFAPFNPVTHSLCLTIHFSYFRDN